MVWTALAILLVLLALAVPVAASLGVLGLALSELYSKLPLTLAIGELAWDEGEPIILDGLIEDVKTLTLSPRDMAFLESGKYAADRIAKGWGVNQISLGQVEGANRASSAVADDHFCQNVINPRLVLISETLTQWLPPLFGEEPGSLLVFAEAAHSVDADLERMNYQFLQQAGAVSRNELRAVFGGLPPIEDGDSCFVPGFGEIIITPAGEGSTGEAMRSLRECSPSTVQNIAIHTPRRGKGRKTSIPALPFTPPAPQPAPTWVNVTAPPSIPAPTNTAELNRLADTLRSLETRVEDLKDETSRPVRIDYDEAGRILGYHRNGVAP